MRFVNKGSTCSEPEADIVLLQQMRNLPTSLDHASSEALHTSSFKTSLCLAFHFQNNMTAAASLASSSAHCACSFQAARPNTRARRQHRLAVTSQATHQVTDVPRTLFGDAGRLKTGVTPAASAACRLHATEHWWLGWP